MKILFLGDVVGKSGCLAVTANLPNLIKKKKIDFVIINGENAADQGVGITEKISNDLFNSGADVITTGNHVWDQKEALSYIDKENRLLRPENLIQPSPGKGFKIFKTKNNFKIGVLNLMGNIFMKKCDDVFEASKEFIKKNNLNRLGYGGGYYDRVIAKLSRRKKILKIGLAFSVQKINNVPVSRYDKKLDYIVTDKYIL